MIEENTRVRKAWQSLADTILYSGIKEKDYWFLVSDWGQELLLDKPPKVQQKVRQIIADFEKEHCTKFNDFMACVNSLVDDDFVKTSQLVSKMDISQVCDKIN